MRSWIKSNKYEFDFSDITTFVVVVAVVMNLCGLGYIATWVFVVNCIACIVYSIVKVKRFNILILNIALLVFNIYFLFI